MDKLKKYLSAPAWFVAFALLFGGIIALALPPGQAPDEYQHFGRAYALSEGVLFPTEAMLPKGVNRLFGFTSSLPFNAGNKLKLKELLAFGGLPLDEQHRAPKQLPASSVYSPLPYLFSAAGIALARAAGLSPLWIYYAGRLVNLLIWTILAALGLRRTPVFRWVFLLLLLAPMSLSQAASYSADSLTNALSFLWICLALEMAFGGRPVALRQVIVLLAFAVILPLTKPPYAALLLAAAVIPTACFGSRRRRVLTLLAMLALAVPLIYISAGINRDYYYSLIKFPGVDAAAQQAGLLTHPLTFLKATVQTLVEDGRFMLEAYTGILGWLDTRLPGFIYWSYPLILLLAALVDSRRDIRIEAWQKILLVLSGLLAFVLVAAGQWITWTALNARKVSDIQGRYLIPVVPPILLGLYNHQFEVAGRFLPIFAPAYSGVVLLCTIISIVQRYYSFS
jgi:uncharacterized membrane protein